MNRESFAYSRQSPDRRGGIDIDPESAVAFATLVKAARSGIIEEHTLVLLNVTGGGRHRLHRDRRLIPARPTLQIDQQEMFLEETPERIANLFR